MQVIIKVKSTGPNPSYQDGDIVSIVGDNHVFSDTEKSSFLIIKCYDEVRRGKTSIVYGEGNKILAKRRWFIPYWDIFTDNMVDIRTPSIMFESDTIYSLDEIAVDKEVAGLLEGLE